MRDVRAGKGDYPQLLPALSSASPSESNEGPRARGGFVVDLKWSNGVLDKAKIRPVLGKALSVRYRDKEFEMQTQRGQVIELGPGL